MTKVLVIAAHPDDEVLGAGGTIAKYTQKGEEVYLTIVTKAYAPEWSAEIIEEKRKETLKAAQILGIKDVSFLELPTVKLDTLPQKELIEHLARRIAEVRPNLLYLPHGGDVNPDHRLTFEAAMVAARPKPGFPIKEVLCYETPSSTEWSAPFDAKAFLPNVFVDISETLPLKLEALAVYRTELKEYPHPRSPEAVSALAKWRGATIGVKAAEAFMLVRMIRD